jgi:hypothetical protein
MIAKSFVPGRGFVSASKLGVPGLRKVVKPGQYKARPDAKLKAVKAVHTEAKNSFNMVRSFGKPAGYVDGVKTTSVGGLSRDTHLAGLAWKDGGPRSRRQFAYDAGLKGHEKATVFAHENAHTAPNKRSNWRLAQVIADPKKHMREEARADMAAGSFYRKKDYAARKGHAALVGLTEGSRVSPDLHSALKRLGNDGYASAAASGPYRRIMERNNGSLFAPQNMQAYRETQNRIHSARTTGAASQGLVGRSTPKKVPNMPGARHTTTPGAGQVPRGTNRRRNIGVGVGAGTAATVGAGTAVHQAKKVSKSYMPGRGFIKAQELGVPGLRHAGLSRMLAAPTKSAMPPEYSHLQGVFAKAKPESTTKLRNGRTVHVYDAAKQPQLRSTLGGDLGSTLNTGGKRGTAHVVMDSAKKTPKSMVLSHEMAHASPARSSWRQAQIAANPAKRIKEERRAYSVTKSMPDSASVHVPNGQLIPLRRPRRKVATRSDNS